MLPNEEWAAYLLTRRARYRVLTMALENTYELLVRGLPVPCKRCGRDGMAIALIHPDFEEPDYLAAVTADGELVLAFAKELLLQARHTTLAGTIKYRRDPHVGGRHLSCGCARCDALFERPGARRRRGPQARRGRFAAGAGSRAADRGGVGAAG